MNDRSAARIRGLRANALAATVMLLIQYCFGSAVGLYSVLPVSDHGKDLFGAFGAAVANGPVLLTLHAVLGTLLLVTALAAVIRSSRVGVRPVIALAITFLTAIASFCLDRRLRFVGQISCGTLLTMGIATAVALLAYALIIFVAGVTSTPGASPAAGQTEGRAALFQLVARDRVLDLPLVAARAGDELERRCYLDCCRGAGGTRLTARVWPKIRPRSSL